MPLFAAGAAQMRGIPVAEICTVYGVALAAVSPDTHPGAEHMGGDCALTALAALSATDTPTLLVHAAHFATPERHSERGAALRDRCALWASRLEHGPPTLA